MWFHSNIRRKKTQHASCKPLSAAPSISHSSTRRIGTLIILPRWVLQKHMERKRLRKELEKLLGDYVSTTLREKEFDPKGRRESSSLDDLAHYDLAIGVALQWLSSSSCNEALKKERIKLALNQHKYPNRMEREAMILSSFAGTLMHSLPVDDVFEIYGSKPSAMHLHSSAKGHCVQPFNLSLHPFAMLTAPQAARHALKHCARFCKYLGRNENGENENHNSKVIATHHHEPDSEREEEASAVSETEEDTAAKTESEINL